MTTGMSQAGLNRCRRIYICYQIKKSGSYRAQLTVKDPRAGGKSVADHTASVPSDVERIRRAWMGSYQVPPELVFESELEICGRCQCWFERSLPDESDIELCSSCQQEPGEDDAGSIESESP